MIFIGDVHGKYSQFESIVKKHPGQSIWQVGDMGIGFGRYPHEFQPNVRFIRGNHDNPLLCQEHMNYLGDYGLEIFREKEELRHIFYVSGAYSVDRAYRIEGKSWWRAEELTYKQGNECLDEYLDVRPEVVMSHDCPERIVKLIHGNAIKTSTTQLLEEMFENHKPKLWVFGHHHMSWKMNVEGTQFICLNELEVFQYI